MRKYWKLIGISMFILIGISMFYMNASSVSKKFVHFKFATVEGNEEAVERLVINGDLYKGMNGYEPFRVSNEGTTFLRDEPFSKRLVGYYPDSYSEGLQKEYRSFMRGKQAARSNFYETDELLAYATTSYSFWSFDAYEFEIAVLNKQTNQVVAFTPAIPNREEYWYVDSYGVYVDENELSIITLNEQANDPEVESASVHIYTYDLGTEKLINEEIVGSLDSSSNENGYNDIHIVVVDENVVISQQEITYIEAGEEFGYEQVKPEKVISYNVKTKAREDYTMSENKDMGMPFTMNNEDIFFANVLNQKLEIARFNLKENKIIKKAAFEVSANYLSIYDIYQGLVSDGKYYFVPSTQEVSDASTITVIDLDSLTVDYLGKIEPVGSIDVNEPLEMYFNYPELKK